MIKICFIDTIQNQHSHYTVILFVLSCFHSLIFLSRFSVDATFTDGIGKYINDSPVPNCSMKIVVRMEKPHLCLRSLKYIKEDTELRYNYGVKGLWWRGKVMLKYICALNRQITI